MGSGMDSFMSRRLKILFCVFKLFLASGGVNGTLKRPLRASDIDELKMGAGFLSHFLRFRFFEISKSWNK